MPAHLKKYMGPDKPAYVPQHVQTQLNQQMQKAMPSYLKQYSGAYVQQKVVDPGLRRGVGGQNAFAAKPDVPSPPPTPDLLRKGHSMAAGQYTVNPETLKPQGYQPADVQPQQAAAPVQSGPGAALPQYDFIMNPQQTPPDKRRPAFGGAPPALKLLYISGGALLLLIVLVAAKTFLSSPGNFDHYVSLAQDQAAMVHITTAANTQDDLSVQNKYFAATAQLSLTSSQSEILRYLKQNKLKVDSEQLAQKIDKSADKQLVDAAAAATYDQTFREIMLTKLNDHIGRLEAALEQAAGPTGSSLLQKQLDQARLLRSQLGQADTALN